METGNMDMEKVLLDMQIKMYLKDSGINIVDMEKEL